MSSGSSVLLILGYQIALTSRKPKQEHSPDVYVNISSDLSDPESVVRVLSEVKEKLGIPSVVVYNAGAAAKNDANDPLSLSLADFVWDLSVNTTNIHLHGEHTEHHDHNPASEPRRWEISNGAHDKSAASAYAERGFKFYYADERKTDGSPAYFDVDGDAHATHYVQLAEAREQGRGNRHSRRV
ncbi:short-chain dehydrogenase [Seiridium cupressi]